MKLLITCVCYNNFPDALSYIESLSKSLSKTSNIEILDLYLVNNGIAFTTEEIKKISTPDMFNVNIVENPSNNGYFPGCFAGYNQSLKNGVDYNAMLISNVDLQVEPSFFNELVSLESYYQSTPVIIAPSIISLSEKKDRNPKIKARFSKKQMHKYLFLYAIPYLHYLYTKTVYKLKRNKKSAINNTAIYAPHGSFVVFLQGAKQWKDFLDYPVFLFGEEIHIGEIARFNNIPVKYHTELKIVDSDHASTGKESSRFIRKHNLKAIQYLINKYW